ncbi:hypothetical protein IV203_019633 [Nitzschia inconspicua]|uniref:Uncharacterized protein n=1 Tax=Nitzschia inconspicua TaxID=303405 RepID=A0A9K3LYV5_9STRA|nr:hypothetical protein IV203_019633 [Nitzschia inconspicua]
MSMLPRLKPRPRRLGPENVMPTDLNASTSTTFKNQKMNTDRWKESNCNADAKSDSKESILRTPLLDSKQTTNPSTSSSTKKSSPRTSAHWAHSPPQITEAVTKTPVRQGRYHKNNVPYTSFAAEFSIDITLTPPARPSQSLSVASKRNSSEIRQANTTKRRRCRQKQDSKDTVLSSILITATTNPKSSPNSNEEFLLNDRQTRTTSEHNHGDLSDDNTKFPFLVDQGHFLSQKERTKQYWEWCYGKRTLVDNSNGSGSFSAKRMPPTKGCLSSSKPHRTHSKSFNVHPNLFGESRNARKNCHVQFGSPTAVEYDVESCSRQLTPMPDDKVRGKYSMTPNNPTQEEEELVIETKHNNAILSEWEGLEAKSTRSIKKARKNAKMRNKKNRRESALFACKTRPWQCDESNDERTHGRDKEDFSYAMDQGDAFSSPSEHISEGMASLRVSTVAIEENTTELMANLHSLNESGVACTSNTNGSCDKVLEPFSNAEGDAPSDKVLCQGLSCNVHDATLSKKNETINPRPSMKNGEGVIDDVIDILKVLYQNPNCDQEIHVPLSLQFLSRIGIINGVDLLTVNVLQWLDPFFLDVMYNSAEEYLTDANHCTPVSVNSPISEAAARRRTISLWKWAEVEFIPCIIERLKAKEKSWLPFYSSVAKHIAHESDVPGLELEIQFLEREIETECHEIDKLSAALGPASFLQCHATTWTNLLGFHLEKFDDGEFVLRWQHMEDLETALTFRTDVVPDCKISPLCSTSIQCAPEIRQALEVGMQLLTTNLREDLGDLELKAAILRLAKCFSKLDQILLAIQRVQIAQGFSVFVDTHSPTISICGTNKTYRLSLGHDLSLVSLVILDAQGAALTPTSGILHLGISIPECIERIINY